ncbi:hypothetical protein SALBM135S_00806 [Streptomyces alboniger]
MIPLSYAQRRLWFLDRFEGASATYNVPLALHLTGDLDTDALTTAVRDVVARHEVLRTVLYEEAGVPYQRVLPVGEAVLDVPVVPVSPDEVDHTIRETISYAFDLYAEIPVRACVLRHAPDAHVLVLLFHHIAADGESAVPLLRDLSAAYTARRWAGRPAGRSWRSSTPTTRSGSATCSATRRTPSPCCTDSSPTGASSWPAWTSR